ncbi:MAG: hypothetical protein H7840_12170 [Alphaproteobacteria bacterium]
MRVTTGLSSVLAILAAAVLLALPMVWNGYPFVFFDTKDYLEMSFTWEFLFNRTMPYAVFLAATHLGVSLWITAAVQCLMVAHVLHEALAVFSPVPAVRALLPMTALLLVLTGVGFFTGQIMPDIFTGVVALAVPTLALGVGRLSLARRIGLAVVVAVAASTHSSNLLLAFGLAGCAGVAVVFRSWWPGVRRDVWLPIAAALGGVAMILTVHWAVTGRVVLSQSGSVFLLARMMQDGLAQRYLNDICPPLGEMATEGPAAGLRLCPVRDRLPLSATQFLWNPWWGGTSPFVELGGWIGLRSEAARVVAGSLKAYPGAHLGAALKETALQLIMTGTGDGLERHQWLKYELEKDFPHEVQPLLDARQQAGDGIDFEPINAVHIPLLILATLATAVIAARTSARREGMTSAMATFLLLAVLGNAFICGALSNPNARYQSRVVWVAVFAVAVAAMRLRRIEEKTSGPKVEMS